MKITPDTATSLGNKLAELDLTDEEGVLLTTLLSAPSSDEQDDSDDDVQGFYYTITMTNAHHGPRVLGQLPGSWKIEQGKTGSRYTEVEWTY